MKRKIMAMVLALTMMCGTTIAFAEPEQDVEDRAILYLWEADVVDRDFAIAGGAADPDAEWILYDRQIAGVDGEVIAAEVNATISNSLLNGSFSITAFGVLSAELGYQIDGETAFNVTKLSRPLSAGEEVYIYYIPKFRQSKVRVRRFRQNTETGEIVYVSDWEEDIAQEAMNPDVMFSYGAEHESARMLEIYTSDENGNYSLTKTIVK